MSLLLRSTTLLLRPVRAAVLLLLAATLVLGVLFPLAGVALARVLPSASVPVATASTLDASGFVGRPSAGSNDPLASGGSNLGPNDEGLLAEQATRRAEVAAREGVPAADVPDDAVTASGSGLDPDISPAYAELQVPRVARETGLGEAEVRELVARSTSGRTLGVLGAPRVDVVTLNRALARALGDAPAVG
ncbi:potassium-transporting ATPase subunit C [Kineococcus gynurae]|uniref:Potassium-transporting ATPase subunit C n=1 Tax=Kineococcus gynurae TaxID=452979 RepID=A0ABV5LP10_9ACTN